MGRIFIAEAVCGYIMGIIAANSGVIVCWCKDSQTVTDCMIAYDESHLVGGLPPEVHEALEPGVEYFLTALRGFGSIAQIWSGRRYAVTVLES